MTYLEKLHRRLEVTGSALCVGLDPRPDLIDGSVEAWLERVIEETAPHAAAFKPNSAYFEAMGPDGFHLLQRIIQKVPEEIPVILDAKRGDIGETQRYYAKACFDVFGADAVTLNPFMGRDTIEPFLEYEGKGLYLLAVTSNKGSEDIQRQPCGTGFVFDIVSGMTEGDSRIGLVVGLTNAAGDVLSRIPDVPLLIPGLGAQGGELSAMREQKRLAPVLYNVSRGILFPADGMTHASEAQRYAHEITRHTRTDD